MRLKQQQLELKQKNSFFLL